MDKGVQVELDSDSDEDFEYRKPRSTITLEKMCCIASLIHLSFHDGWERAKRGARCNNSDDCLSYYTQLKFSDSYVFKSVCRTIHFTYCGACLNYGSDSGSYSEYAADYIREYQYVPNKKYEFDYDHYGKYWEGEKSCEICTEEKELEKSNSI